MKSHTQGFSLPIIILIAGLAILAGGIGYYLVTQETKDQQALSQQIQENQRQVKKLKEGIQSGQQARCDITTTDFKNLDITTSLGSFHFRNGIYNEYNIGNQGKRESANPEWEDTIINSQFYSFESDAVRIVTINRNHLQGSGTNTLALGYICVNNQLKEVLAEGGLGITANKKGDTQLELFVGEGYQGAAPPAKQRIILFRWSHDQQRFTKVVESSRILVTDTSTTDTSSQKITEGCTILPYTQGKPIDSFDIRGGAVCRYKIHPDLPVYIFHLVGNPELNEIDRVEVTKEGSNEIIQTFGGGGESPHNMDELFFVQDVNFDGYKDIRMLAWWSADSANKGYSFWVFDPSKKLFVENDDLSNLTNPVANAKTKTINAYGSSRGDGGSYTATKETYTFTTDGKLILMREEKYEGKYFRSADQHFIKTVSELRNGKMVVISTEIVKDLGWDWNDLK